MSTPHVRLALPEIRRMAPDALRMLGVPIGQAEETSEAVVWTEAVIGGALRFLRLHSTRMLWVPRPRVAVHRQGNSAWLVDARGGSLLEFGMRIMDFARSEAASATSLKLRVRNTYGTIFLPYLFSRIDEHGYSASALPSPREGCAKPMRGDLPESRHDVDLHVTQASSGPQASTLGEIPHDADERFRSAMSHGVSVSEVDAQALMDRFEHLRVPTSERSRSHAG